MPRKNRIPAPAVQNRDNQRRSRARRRQLIEELQHKLQDYERRGVQASIGMQRVAQAVAWENKHLRGLLHLRGVSQHDIDAHLSLTGSIGTEPNPCHREFLQRGTSPLSPRAQRCNAMKQPSTDKSRTIATYPQDMDNIPRPLSTPPFNSPSSITSRGLETPAPARSTRSADVAERGGVATTNRDHQKGPSYDSPTTQLPDRASISFICNDSFPDDGSRTDILPPVTDCFCPPDSPVSVSGHWNRGLSCKTAIEILTGL
ncbi:uncharacterized protein F5Z01DRAFT_638196 [Emericellopsis atlantica]|uniref:BZIP domain-containing protein n=1 Tax=Emericellopsis atlantica TaxID=2614577 RepID=A0A9P7ZII7_9HYPO|nr:uncharacterized protein F5Z01DRAFT_638196 [Emericellopsis atlantica]KAG9252699.1 hypothetical protein F5Z01DRAFT_638196 [Emericellopsis atlantica]